MRLQRQPIDEDALNISNNTLKTRLRNIYQKIGIGGRQEMLAAYYRFITDSGRIVDIPTGGSGPNNDDAQR